MSIDEFLRDRYWHLVCHRSEVAAHRDYLRLEWVGGEVVVYNDNGSVIVFDNVCPHRGARFFGGHNGSQLMMCPYHGWTYRNGRIHTPNHAAVVTTGQNTPHLNEYQTEWCGEFLFFAKQPLQPLTAQLGGIAPIVEQISRSIDGCLDFRPLDFEADWRVALENALETYHVPLVHGNTLARLKLGNDENRFFGVNAVWHAKVGDDATRRQLESMTNLFSLDYAYNGSISVFLFPFVTLSSLFGYSYSFQNSFPSSEQNRTHLTNRLLRGKLASGVPPKTLEPFFQQSVVMNRQVLDEDHMICKKVNAAAWSPNPPPLVGETEEKVLHFRRGYRAALEQHSQL